MSSPTDDARPERGTPRDLERILHVELPVIAVLAEKRMKMAEVLNLSVGGIVQLDKSSEALLELRVNDRPVGRGEAVHVGEHFGLQLTEVGTPRDTLRKLGGKPPSAPR